MLGRRGLAMRVSALVAVLLASGTAHGDELAPIPSWGAVLVGSRLVNLEPDLLALRGVELATGATAWRTVLRAEAAGAVELTDLKDGRVYVHAGNDLAIVDVATGAIRAQRQGPWNQVDDRAYLRRAPGVCALQRQCRLELVACETLAAIGAPLEGHVVRRYRQIHGRVSTQHDTGCWGWRPFVLGRAGGVVVVVTDRRPEDVPAPASSENARAITLGLDAATGAVRWASNDLTCASCSTRTSGISPDGRTCWLGEASGAVRVFDCATGRQRFHAGLRRGAREQDASHEAVTAWTPGGLAVSVPPRIVLHDLLTGRAIWSRPVARDTIAVPIGGRIGEEPYAPDHRRSLRVLDLERGQERATLDVPPGARVVQAPDGGLLVEGSSVALGPDGLPRNIPTPAAPVFAVERLPGRTVVRASGRPAPLLDVLIDGESLGEVRRGARDCVVVRLVPRDRVGAIRVLCR